MWVFGRMLAIIGSLTIWNSWQFLEKRLRIEYNIYKRLIKYSISPTFITTVIAAEDHRFYNHGGADPIAIVRSIFNLVARKKWEGGSTIRLLKNSFLENQKNRCL